MARPRFPLIPTWLLVGLAQTLAVSGRAAGTQETPTSITVLQREIEAVLHRSSAHTPGAAIAIVRRDGPEWVAGLGLSDVATHRPATADTLFRIGSVSKTFVALSVLKLQQEGKLDLQDTLKSRAPDLEFFNPWEATDPVRIVHLLEHTAGWDELALREFAFDPPEEVSLQAGLAIRPATRTSRWKPGTRFSYSNAGPAAAAYVVEKVTGQRFEDYVEENWFRPLGMRSANYFGNPDVLQRLTRLYRSDGITPYSYWKDSLRPAGSINASARDMANYLQFFLNHGRFDGVQLLPETAMQRMEEPSSTYAARQGLKTGYGLNLGTRIKEGRVYHGHDGAVPGGLTDFAYLSDAGVGYCVMINSRNTDVLQEICLLLRKYIAQGIPLPSSGATAAVSTRLRADYEGWYEAISPRAEVTRFFTRLFAFKDLVATPDGLTWGSTKFVATTDRLFRRASDPVPTLALISDHAEGTLVQEVAVEAATYRRIPGIRVALEWTAELAAVALMVSSIGFAVVWIPRRLWGRLRGANNMHVRVWPFLASLTGAVLLLVFLSSLQEDIERLGRITPWSVAIFLLSVALPVLGITSLAVVWRARRTEPVRLVWWHSLAVSLAATSVALYLMYWGICGIRTWA